MDLFSNAPRKVYEKNPIFRVICQIKFPTLLRINSNDPAEFQEVVRDMGFPLFYSQLEKFEEITECDTESNTKTRLLNNYHFLSEDKTKQINLTSGFISYSVKSIDGKVVYNNWNDFKNVLYPILELFELEYRPAFYERIGLRYFDAINKEELFTEECTWKDLLHPHVLGLLNADGISKEQIGMCVTDAVVRLDPAFKNRYIKLHTGLGKISGDDKVQFIIDSDFYAEEQANLLQVKEILDYLHAFSGKFIRGCFTNKLDDALGEIR